MKTTTNLTLADVTFAASHAAVGLQMADLIAYEARKALTAVILDDEERGIRDEWMELMRAGVPRHMAGVIRGYFPAGLQASLMLSAWACS